MRSDVAGLRTWWLVALGGWALAVWTATLFGLGGRIGTASAAMDVPALPAVPVADPLRAAATDNAEAMARPLFASDRRPHPFLLAGEGGEAQNAGTVRLSGVLITPGMEMATLTTEQGQSLRLRVGGEAQAGWQLLSVQPRAAVVSGPSGTLNLELQVFSGSGKPEAGAPLAASGVAVPPPPNPPTSTQPAGPSAEPVAPSADQIKAIRDRIQARRRQAQQQQAGAPGGQKP